MLFSERKGLSFVKNVIQKDEMDEALRTKLWNALHICIWDAVICDSNDKTIKSSNLEILFAQYWHNFFKIQLDTLPVFFEQAKQTIRSYFFKCKWNEVYDFIEFTAQNCPEELKEDFIYFCNRVLEKELSAYRFVDLQLTDITAIEEIESIELAINSTTKYSGTSDHLRTALSFLSDRKSPDYRNSVKESISAVEALCISVSGEPKATLGFAINKIEKTHQLHPAFKKALSNLYGYTSDSNGIRHALLEENTITFTDAKFMLVSCSTFINYVLGKLSENN